MRALKHMGDGAGDRDSHTDLTVPQQLVLAYEQEVLSSDGHLLATREQERILTDEQELAVARRSGSLLLAAGAGSGKTSVLVERFVRAVREDGVAPGRILAITFTERAAGELRERVRARMLELGDREAARDTEAANVCTFHGFCARLLRAHPVQAGVEPGFEILEEGVATRLRVLAFSEALMGFLAGERQEAIDLVAAYGADPLRSMVLGAYAQLRSMGQAEPRLVPAAFQTRMKLHIEEQESSFESDSSEEDENHEGEPLEGGEPSEGDTLQGGGHQERDPLQRGERPERDPSEEGEHQEGDSSEVGGDQEREVHAMRVCELIGELLERFGVSYAQRKHARAALDFDDLELSARDLLEGRADVRESWAERLQLLMVDEFQDSSPRQLQVLAALDRDNLFTVGDELQSIYGFRHADVGVFRERRERLGAAGASFALTRNFRSRPAILAAVERIFAARIGEHFTSLTAARVEEDEEARTEAGALTGDLERPDQSSQTAPGEAGHKPIVELLLTDKRGWEHMSGDEELAGLPETTSWRQAEARLLAQRIAEILASGQARAGDVVVLLRALGDLPVYENALRSCGLRTLAAVGGFWSHQQVGDLLAWLRALANPLDELALYSTLASPLVGVSSDGLALIASAARKNGRGVWQAIVDDATALDALLPLEDRTRVAAFRELFVPERKSAALHPISQLLRRAIAATGYEQHVLSLGWGERRLANVHKLVGMARRFEAREGRDLRRFLDHVAHLEVALAGREADAAVGDGQLDAVRLMSIHAAKGLEFPVVCVADLGRDPNLRVPDLLVDSTGGRIGLRLQELGNPVSTGALDFEELREERRAAQEEEEDRVLYVACTRAEKRLLLSGSVAFASWPQAKPGVAPIAWLAPALVPDAPKLAGSDAPPVGALTVDLAGGLSVRCVFHRPGSTEQARSSSSAKEAQSSGSVKETQADRAPRDPSGSAPVQSTQCVEPVQPEPAGPPIGQALPAPVTRSEPSARLLLADPDATMSYTSLAELERCGYRYYLERILRLPENRAAARAGRDDGGTEARARGTIVHALLESIDFTRPRPPTAQDVARIARRIRVELSSGEREDIVGLIAAALACEPARLLAGARRARREHPFAFSLGANEPLVTGVLDLIVEQIDGSSLIVDYKSDRLVGGEDLETLVERDYGFQRLLYALAAIEAGESRVTVAHWYLERPNEWVTARFEGHERDVLREQLLERISDTRDKGFAVSQTPNRVLCLTCPGRIGLCSWGETRTMSERSTTLESG